MLQPWLQFSPISSDNVLLTSSAHHRISYLPPGVKASPHPGQPCLSFLCEVALLRKPENYMIVTLSPSHSHLGQIKKLSHQSGMVRYGGFGQEPTTVVLKGILVCFWSKNIKTIEHKRKTWRHISDWNCHIFGRTFAGRFQHSATNDQDFSQRTKDSSRSQEKIQTILSANIRSWL